MRRHADWIVLAVLFTGLTALSWRRWASFDGDLNREWTTPMRIASGERLYRDVAFYYGPLVPYAEGLAMRAFGARVGTAIGFGMLNAAALLALLLVASRGFLSVAARAGVAAAAAGVFAFAPENGAFIACYSQSALAAVGLSWLSFALAARGRARLAGVAAGLALLAKPEAALALAAAVFVCPRASRLPLAAIAGALAITGYAAAFMGLSVEELVRYGPLRHVSMPPEFAELYRRVSGLHPALFGRGATGLAAGAALLLGWALAGRGVFSRAWQPAAAGAALLAAGFALRAANPPEPFLTTVVRGLPCVLLVAIAVAARDLASSRRAPSGDSLCSNDKQEGRAARDSTAVPALALGTGILGSAFIWRTTFWTVPLFPYAPLAAVSSLPAVTYLLERAARGLDPSRRRLTTGLLLLPLLASPLAALPRLVEFYRSPRVAVDAPRGLWYPPGDQGAIFAALVKHLASRAPSDRSLAVLPEASALNFLLGVRSPLRMEQLIPGLVDVTADADAATRLRSAERVVWIERPTPEYGRGVFGRDYALATAATIRDLYREDTRLGASGSGPGVTILVRR